MIIFGFKNTNSEKILENIACINTQKLLINRNPDLLLSAIKSNKPSVVIGLGEYSGRDQDKIRVETICRNKFRNTIIIEDQSYEITIQSSISADENFKLGVGMGNSWCNLISFEICSRFPDINYSFLHIPKSITTRHALRLIKNKLFIPS